MPLLRAPSVFILPMCQPWLISRVVRPDSGNTIPTARHFMMRQALTSGFFRSANGYTQRKLNPWGLIYLPSTAISAMLGTYIIPAALGPGKDAYLLYRQIFPKTRSRYHLHLPSHPHLVDRYL